VSGAVLTLAAFALLLVACGGAGGEARPACTSVRGEPDDAVSLWSCETDAEAAALVRHYGFSSCDLVQGMDAEATQGDRGYQCRR
jgi:hypothetical protein